MGGTDDRDRPFEDVTLDSAFVKGAARRELTAAERLAAAQRSKDADERLAWQRRAERWRGRPHRRLFRWMKRNGKSALVLVSLAALGWALASRSTEQAPRWVSGRPEVRHVGATMDRPTPRPPESKVPLLQPDAAPTPSSSYRFIATQPDSSAPVTYDPCRTIAVVVNARTAGPVGERLLDEALHIITKASGFAFSVEGHSAERPSLSRDPFRPDLYGDRWSPVLVAWSDPAESPQLLGSVAGSAGSTALTTGRGPTAYLTGTVILDGPQVVEIAEREGVAAARGVILHELAHLVGLAHVNDSTQLMHTEGSSGVTGFGDGDRSGLAALHAAARCLEEL
jgi:hypothetical protein